MKDIKVILASIIAAGALLISCGDDNNYPQPAPTPTPEQPTSGDVRVLTTTANRSKSLAESWINFSTTDNMSPSTIRITPDKTYQTINGFGAAITGSTAYNLLKMTQADRTKFLTETFSLTEGYGMSYIRVSIGCSDFSLSEHTCCDKKGIENFGLDEEDTKYVIPVLKEIIAINPEIKILGSPWTAPRWMKVNNLTDLKPYDSWTGGQLNPAYYQDYATYFVKWVQAYESAGVNIFAITPQNEPLNRGNSASMFMGWEEQRDFIKSALGPKMREAGLDTKIYVFDHNYNYDNMPDQQSYPLKIYADAEASKYIAGAAYHNYGGNLNELDVIHAAAPNKELVFTESTAGDWNDGSNLQKRLVDDMNQICLGTVNRWCNGSLIWNLMLDSQRGPNRPGGCTNGFGAVDISNDYKTIRYNSFYYIMAHMSAPTRPGAVRIGTTGFSPNDLTYTAFKNPDGSFALVLSNSKSEDIKATVDDGSHHFPVTIPGNGIVSLSWN
ncbi:MAG: glycoside hydrolase family 30 beta sandwich domain-containing protein [Bacteroidales bacterium]|nr:glycoside hydrolase family 30 beta sandwich domain-containing protein [Bacteroidales bacterium]